MAGVRRTTPDSMALGEGEGITIRYHTKHTIRRQSNPMTARYLHTHPPGLPKHPQSPTRPEHSKPREQIHDHPSRPAQQASFQPRDATTHRAAPFSDDAHRASLPGTSLPGAKRRRMSSQPASLTSEALFFPTLPTQGCDVTQGRDAGTDQLHTLLLAFRDSHSEHPHDTASTVPHHLLSPDCTHLHSHSPIPDSNSRPLLAHPSNR